MKREILFRGRRVDDGEWVYGYYVQDPSGEHRIYWQPFPEASSNTYHFVIPETVGQFTGLTDKNGKKIFEGDIIYSVNWAWGDYKVQFANGEFYFTTLEHLEKPYTNSIHYAEQFEVKGNIHETKKEAS